MSRYSKIVNDTFIWKIENFSEEKIEHISQVFTSKVLNSSLWFLDLYVHGSEQDKRKFINVYLNRGDCVDQNIFKGLVDFTITILANDVSSNISRKSISNIFGKNNAYNGFYKFLSVEELLAKRNVYLQENILRVECYIEGKIDDSTIARKSESTETLQQSDCNIKGLSNDLLRLYLDSKFCDIKITTEDRVFSVHKTVICARSPVFCAMFENDSKEKNSCAVDITDVDSATVNRLLEFMYSDVGGDMDQKEAEKLYAAADKYGVMPLKQHCSSTLKSLMSNANLADIYTLADMHQDSDLKTVVEGYVFKYVNIVFRSSEWKEFIQLNPKLSAELMHKIWIKLLVN